MLTGISSLLCGEEGNLIQSKQLNYVPDGYENVRVVRQPGCRFFSIEAALFCSCLSTMFCASLLWPALVCSALLQWDIFGITAQPGKHIYSFLDRKGKCSLRAKGAGQKLLPLVPDLSILMQMWTPNPHSLIGLKGTVLIDHNRDAQLQLDRKSLSPVGWDKIPKTPL